MTDNNKGLTSVFRWYTQKFITCTATKQRWEYYTMKINWTTFQKFLCYWKDIMFIQACRLYSWRTSNFAQFRCGLMTNQNTQPDNYSDQTELNNEWMNGAANHAIRTNILLICELATLTIMPKKWFSVRKGLEIGILILRSSRGFLLVMLSVRHFFLPTFYSSFFEIRWNEIFFL